MSRTTVAVTARVPEPLKDKIEGLAEETGNSKSAMTKELIKSGIERREADADEADAHHGRSASPLTILGVAAIVVSPTLLATGYTGVGAVFSMIGAVYALLWVTAYDSVVEEALDAARDELREVGGVIGFFRYVMSEHRVEEPDTVV